MCKVYNTIGALTYIKKHLLQNKVEGFSSIHELISFQNNYETSRQQVLSNQKTLLMEEKNNLNEGISALEHEIAHDKEVLHQKFRLESETLRQQYDAMAEANKTFVQEFTYSFQALFKLLRIYYIQLFSAVTISRAVRPKVTMLDEKQKRFQYLTSNFEEAVTASGRVALDALDHKKRVIDEINTFIYGAIGEQKVVDELKQLPDDYILINDFSYTFTKGIYSKKDRQYIKSIQIDHLLISPAGIFLIETKNWSRESLKSLSLRSPVEQIKRTNFALFVLLKNSSGFKLGKHHWGERKIPIKNLIVLINNKPKEEFEFVKILTLNELLGYVKFFQPSLSNQEVQEVAEYLVKVKN